MGGQFSPSWCNLYHTHSARSGDSQTLGNEKPDRPGSNNDRCVAQVDMSSADRVQGNSQRFGQSGCPICHFVGDAQEHN
jgi:hypothetical protein